jgi:hypothetical protein
MPTIDIPDKICSHCNDTKWFVTYQKYKDKVYTVHTCFNKKIESQKKWISENKDKRLLMYKRSKDKVKQTDDYIKNNRARANKYYEQNPDKVKTTSKAVRLKNPDKYKNICKINKRKYVKFLNDVYIKNLICQNSGLQFGDVPQPLIKLKRKQLLLKRQIKNNGKESNQNN